MQLQSPSGDIYSEEQAITLLVSLVATDPNSEKKWRGFYNSLTSIQLEEEWDQQWHPFERGHSMPPEGR